MIGFGHSPVLLTESIEGLLIKPGSFYVDATYGRGGHAMLIENQLNNNGRLLVIDQDSEAIACATKKYNNNPKIIIKQGNFEQLGDMLEQLQWQQKVAGILFDLGVSSPQLDNSQRGFSFSHTGPLDMRMGQTGVTAEVWLSQVKQHTLADILWRYGEERYSRRIAKAIIVARHKSPITSTTQLADIVTKANPNWQHNKHPATRTFQAIRIFINRELEVLSSALQIALDNLAPKGRIATISFHSLEDRIVKQFIQTQHDGIEHPPGLPIRNEQLQRKVKKIARIFPSKAETKNNPRARSAVLRIMEKL